MDLRDDLHTQIEEHIKTLRIIAGLTPTQQVVWEDASRYLEESAKHLELFVLPKVEPNPSYLDLRTGTVGNAHVAEYVGATSEEAASVDAASEQSAGGVPFMGIERAK